MIKKLAAYLGHYKKYMIYSLFLVMGDVVCELSMPLLMAKIVDEGIPQSDIGFIARIGFMMAGLALLAIGFGMTNMKFSADASQGFAANIRRVLFEKVQSFSFTNIDSFSSASLITRLTSDVTQIQNTIMMSLRMLLRGPLMLVVAVIFVLIINARLSLVIFAALPVLVIVVILVMKTAERLFTIMQQRLDALNSTVQENLIAIRVVKAFVREAHEKLKFKKSNDEFMEAASKAGYLTATIMPIMMFVLNFTTIFVIWFGGNMVGEGTMGPGALISFISYLMQILMSVMMFSMMFLLFARARACARRIVEVLDTEVTITDRPRPTEGRKEPEVTRGKIEFQNVDFRYATGEGKNVLSDISFTAEPGEVVAVIGGTGSGKSSLLSLIPRLYDVTGGRVLVDDIDVRDYYLEALREGIGMVLQQNVLFTGSIRENLMWGNGNASQEDIEYCTRDAQAHDFIIGAAEGYDTVLGQGGVNVSGGQKQRLCIARAMLKKPHVLILDDSTSSVDTATEAQIKRALRNNHKDITVLIVSQRIKSVKDADKIIVLDDGKISGIGTHETLFEDNEIYREICISQQEGRAV
jgi:ATP-binding cassette subfamily B multidrug efflux pump